MNSSTLIIVAGFAYMLQNIGKTLKFRAEGTNHAYLFSYKARLRDRYLGNLMALVRECAVSPKEQWFKRQALHYDEHPIVRRDEFFELCPQYFSVQKQDLREEYIEYSALTQEGITLCEEICYDHFVFFQRLIANVHHRQSQGPPEASCGIVFTSV